MQVVAGRFIAVFWLAALACASVPSAVQAGSVNMTAHGGSDGSSFSLDCGDDAVLVGVRARKGWWVDRIAGLCTRLRDGRRWVADLTATTEAAAGEDGGNEVTVICPRDTAVKALRGRFGSYVNRLILRCRPLVTGVAARTLYVEGSQRGDHAWDYEFCPDGKFARGFHGRAGNYIDRAGLICHTDNTPNLQAPPGNMVAVNVVGLQGTTTTTPTPFVQAQWDDRTTAESGFRVIIGSLSSSFRMNVIAPAAAGTGTRQSVIITDLANGEYGLTVCARFGFDTGTPLPELCAPGQFVFQIAGAVGVGRGAPTVNSVERVGAGTARVLWSHNFVNPSRFDVNARCGNGPLGPVAFTQDGTAREETFNIGVGAGQVRVCAQYQQPAQGFCSALFAFQCN